MHRRGRSPLRSGFLVAIASIIAVLATLLPASAAMTVIASTPDDPEPVDRPPVTVSDFIPENANLSDCVGLVEKPGCGSKARGGWRQFAIFGALAAGLGIVVWRILVGLRANRSRESDSVGGRDDHSSPPPASPPTSSTSQPSPSSPPPTGRNPS